MIAVMAVVSLKIIMRTVDSLFQDPFQFMADNKHCDALYCTVQYSASQYTNIHPSKRMPTELTAVLFLGYLYRSSCHCATSHDTGSYQNMICGLPADFISDGQNHSCKNVEYIVTTFHDP